MSLKCVTQTRCLIICQMKYISPISFSVNHALASLTTLRLPLAAEIYRLHATLYQPSAPVRLYYHSPPTIRPKICRAHPTAYPQPKPYITITRHQPNCRMVDSRLVAHRHGKNAHHHTYCGGRRSTTLARNPSTVQHCGPAHVHHSVRPSVHRSV